MLGNGDSDERKGKREEKGELKRPKEKGVHFDEERGRRI